MYWSSVIKEKYTVVSQLILPNPLTSKDGDSGGLPSPVVAQEGSDLTLIHVEAQFIHCHLPASLVLVTG